MAFVTFTDFEIQQIDRVHAHQLTTNPTTELLICISADGLTAIDEACGSVADAQMTPTMLAHLNGGGQCKLIHNHPSNASISVNDWRLCIAHAGIIEIIAVNSERSTYRAAIVDRVGLNTLLQGRRYPEAENQVNKMLCQEGVLQPTNWQLLIDMEPTVSHVINERLAALTLVEYETVFAGADAVLLQRDEALTLLAAAKGAADQHLP